MYARETKIDPSLSYLILGPRGTGKSTWLKSEFPKSNYVDLLVDKTFNILTVDPDRLETFITDKTRPVIIDEVQKVPRLLNTVHRLIENENLTFILTGSSARKLREEGVNLLAGRAITKTFHPLTTSELGTDFSLDFSLKYGFLPSVFGHSEPQEYLDSYVTTYLREEVLQEGLVRNLGVFSRFLEAASFSQGSVLNISKIASDCAIERRTVSNYFVLLEDLLIAMRLPVFTKKAKREMLKQPKFYFFDCGVYRSIKPTGPLDDQGDIEGIALETLVVEQVRAINDNKKLGYEMFYWRTKNQKEVDLILYGERGIIAIEVKRSNVYRKSDLSGLKLFKKDYPQSKPYLINLGDQIMNEDPIAVVPVETFLKNIENYI